MDLDLRVPVGLLFITLGLIMGIFGLTSDPALYHKSLGINVNLFWGLAQLIFGSLMLTFGRVKSPAAEPATAAPMPATTPARAVTTRHDVPPKAKTSIPRS